MTQAESAETDSALRLPLRQYWELLARHIAPQRGRFALLVVLLLTSIGLQVVNPQIVRTFIDAAQLGAVAARLGLAAAAFIGIALLQQAISIAATYVGETVAWNATNALRAELAWHCLNLDMSFHHEHSPGELIERIDGDVAQLSGFFSQVVVRILGNVLLMVGIVAALCLEDWRIGLAFGTFAAVTLAALVRVRDIAVPQQKALRQANADLFGFLEEQLASTEDVRACGAVEFAIRRLYQLQRAILGHDRRVHWRYLLIWCVAGALTALGEALAILAGYLLYRSGAITIGTVYLLINYGALLARPIHELTYHTEGLQNIGAAVERLGELRRVQSRVADGPGLPLPAGPLALAFNGVSFSYEEDEPVLRDLSFQLEPGKVLGLLGRTGSGKTTLARLVCRLYDPRAGCIALGGVDLRAPALRSLRQRVALVTQDVQLFRGSVRDNLTFFDRSVSDDRIRSVIEELGLAGWYASMPEGLDTQLEAGGRGLSAGEAQLLAFTRVFLRDPGLVILDEASSRLDPATEQRIERAITRLLRGRTAIIIAHRLSTVHRADSIMILEDEPDGGSSRGEFGERAQLAADAGSRFHSLLRTGLEEMLA